MEIKSLIKEDINILLQIIDTFKKKNISHHYGEVLLSQKNNFFLAALIDNKPVGFLLAYELPRIDREKTMLFIYEIEILPQYRNQGLGTALVKKIKTRFDTGKIMKMFVLTNQSNSAAMKLYENQGGKRIYNDDVMFVFEQGVQDEKI